MPFSNLDLITVTGHYLLLNGTNAAGSVTFTSSTVLTDTVANEIIEPVPFTASLVGGAFSIQLPATDDPDLNPNVGVTYLVTENITGTTGRPPYSIEVPWNSPGGTLDLADVAPAVPGPEVFSYVLTSVFNAHVNDTVAHGGGGSTPDATTTVKGKLQLAGDLGGTAAAPTVPGLAGKAATSHAHAEADVTSLVTDLAAKAAKASNLSDLASVSAARTNLGLGTAATANKVAAGTAGVLDATDATTTNTRTPTAHASSHAPAASDDLTTALSATSAPVALAGTASAGTGTGFARQGHVHPTTGLPMTVVEVAGTYPSRPTGAGVALYIGPDQPTDAVNNDIWFNTTPA